MFYDILAL